MLKSVRSVRHGMHVSPAPFRQYKKSSDSRSLVAPNMPSLPDSIRARELVDAAYMHVQSRYPFMQVSQVGVLGAESY